VLVVLDPLSRFAGLEAETDNAVATRFVQSCECLASPDATTVLVSHHNNKVSRGRGDVATADGRGSSAFGDGFRWVASLTPLDVRKAIEDPEERERLGEAVTLSFTKSNYGRKGDQVQLRRDQDRNGALVPLDEVDLATVEAARRANPACSARAATAEAEMAERDNQDDAAAQKAWASNPTASVRDITTIVRNVRRCGQTRAFAVARRTRPE
jgi:RecA-family ATPase